MSTYAHFFRKRNKNLVDVLVQIESGTKSGTIWNFLIKMSHMLWMSPTP